MEDTVKNEQKKVKLLLVLLIVLVLFLISGVYALLGLRLLLVEKTGKETNNTIIENNNKKEEPINDATINETTKVEDKKENEDKNTTIPEIIEEEDNASKVQLKDTFAIDVHTEESGVINTVILNYLFLKDGKVYVDHKVLDNIGSEDDPYYDFSAPSLSATYPVNIEGKEIEGLPPIKRIKGTYRPGTDPTTAVLLVAENGEVYSYVLSGWNSEIEKAKYLDDYKVDDIISYYVVGGCFSEDPNFKTCGGEYHIIDQNGKAYHHVVNTDGSLTEK